MFLFVKNSRIQFYDAYDFADILSIGWVNNMDISDLLKNEEVQRYVKNSANTVYTMIYNEMYLYIWLICIYSVSLFILVLLNFVWLMRLVGTRKAEQVCSL